MNRDTHRPVIHIECTWCTSTQRCYCAVDFSVAIEPHERINNLVLRFAVSVKHFTQKLDIPRINGFNFSDHRPFAVTNDKKRESERTDPIIGALLYR